MNYLKLNKMESPAFTIKKNLVFDSPDTFSITKHEFKRTIIKFSLENVNDSLVSISCHKQPIQNIDDNSCDSAFSEPIEEIDDEMSQATNLDDSFSFKSLETENSFSFYDDLECIDSPITQFNRVKSKQTIINDSPEFNHQQVKKALDIFNYSTDRLIGDMSRTHTLPILKQSRHNDLASIDPNTLVDLLNGKYDEKIAKYFIFDARYPYEYNGGHINGAESGFVKEGVIEKLFKEPIKCEKPVILIFHCEFSAERGPKLMREIRERDRTINKKNYPNLFYPEIYLLEGGYKQFYESHEHLCEPRSYLPMLHNEHRNDMKFFRKKSKTWEIETRKSKFATKAKLFI